MEIVFGITVVVLILAISVTLHEAMHAFTSYWLGDDTAMHSGRMSLNPIRHIDPVMTVALPLVLYILSGPIFGAAKPVPFNPNRVRFGEYGAALVGLSGPATNFLLALVAGLSIRLLSAIGSGPLIIDFLGLFMIINIGFFVFNMLPFPPLDGSRILYAVAPDGLRNIMRQIESFGLLGIGFFILLLLPYLSPAILKVISFLFVLMAGVELDSVI